MVKIYVRKIEGGEINPATGEAWKIDDVPETWREAVREALEKNETKVGRRKTAE